MEAVYANDGVTVKIDLFSNPIIFTPTYLVNKRKIFEMVLLSRVD